MWVLQGSPASPILFVIYQSGTFKEVEEEMKGFMATSFANDYGRLVTADLVAQLWEHLERAGEKVVKRGEDNHVEFDNVKILVFR